MPFIPLDTPRKAHRHHFSACRAKASKLHDECRCMGRPLSRFNLAMPDDSRAALED